MTPRLPPPPRASSNWWTAKSLRNLRFTIDVRLKSATRKSYIVYRNFMEYWEQRYQTRDMPWEKGAPSPGLVDFLAAHRDLSHGTVCVPGCGSGHDVLELARAGFTA